MRLHVVDHPLVAHKLTALRDRAHRLPDVPPPGRRARHPARLRGDSRRARRARTNRDAGGADHRVRLSAPKPLVVPILRAGLGMLDGMTRLVPTAEVGFLGMIRDEQTLQAITYATRLPEDLSGRQVFLLDPMLATGGTLAAAMRFVFDARRGRRHRDLPARGARGCAGGRGGLRPGRRPSPSSPRGSTSGSTSSATSCRASATPATACTAWSEPPPRRSVSRDWPRHAAVDPPDLRKDHEPDMLCSPSSRGWPL